MKIQIILLIFLLSIGTASAAKIMVVPHTQDVQPGDFFTADIKIIPQGANIAGWEFDLVFNPGLVQVISVTEEDFLKEDEASTLFLAGTINNIEGKLVGVTSAITTPGKSVKKPGIAATIHLKALQVPGTSPLLLQSVTIGDANGAPLPVSINSGEVVLIPEIASIGLLASGLIGLIVIKRGK